jgi:hypothetical protein
MDRRLASARTLDEALDAAVTPPALGARTTRPRGPGQEARLLARQRLPLTGRRPIASAVRWKLSSPCGGLSAASLAPAAAAV